MKAILTQVGDLFFVLSVFYRGVTTWLESGREKRNLGMAGLTAALQVSSPGVNMSKNQAAQ